MKDGLQTRDAEFDLAQLPRRLAIVGAEHVERSDCL
jgi:hypothetical protein